jgi:hypothetical protein
MQYLAEPSKVVYRAKEGSEENVFDALVWLPAMPCSINVFCNRVMFSCLGGSSAVIESHFWQR